MLIEPSHSELSIARQCNLLDLPRSSYYYTPKAVDEFTLAVMHAIDRQYMKTPFYGILKMTDALNRQGLHVNHKRVRRLMRQMGIYALAPQPNTSKSHPNHKIYPYLLRGVKILYPNHVWSSDITYIPLSHGYVYLVAIIDWYSRYVLSWQISNTLDVRFCLEALEDTKDYGKPEIFNTDQGSQFTSDAFTQNLEKQNILISMDGRGRALDNVFIERLWRSVKYENIYLHDYQSILQLMDGLGLYFQFYNEQRSHQSLGYKTPGEVYEKNRGRMHLNSCEKLSKLWGTPHLYG